MSLETLVRLKKQKSSLDEEIKGLRNTISQRNVELTESHNQRRNLEEELNRIALRNNGLEQVDLVNNHTMEQMQQQDSVEDSASSHASSYHGNKQDSADDFRMNRNSIMCDIL